QIRPVLKFGSRRLATFITRGIPYGYFYGDAVSTHLFSQPMLGETINAGIFAASFDPFICCAVLVDPGDFDDSETPTIRAQLESEAITVINVVKKDANLENVRLLIKTFPYDLLFICSH